MKQVILISAGQYRLVRYEPSGDARIEHEDDETHSDWLTAEDVDKVRGEPWLMQAMAGTCGPSSATAVRIDASSARHADMERKERNN